MEEASLFSLPEGMHVERIQINEQSLVLEIEASASLKKAYDLLQDFLTMAHKREGQRLDSWLATVAESGLPELQSFAAGVEKDKDGAHSVLYQSHDISL